MNRITNRHFLQSSQWAKFQKQLDHTVFARAGDGWEFLAILEHGDGRVGRVFNRLYLPYGPTYYNEQGLESALIELDKLAKQKKVDYVRNELYMAYEGHEPSYDSYGYKKHSRTSQPDLTLLIDLNRPWEQVRQDISKTNKYAYNKATKNGLEFRISYSPDEVEPFAEMMRETASRTKSIFHAEKYYCKLLKTLGPEKFIGIAYAVYDNNPVVGILFVDDLESGVRYYMHAGSFDKARELRINANASLVMFLLENAHKNNIKIFDFFGVAPKDAPSTHRWAGFSRFKRSFGGQDFQYSGTWEKPTNRFKYSLLTAMRKLR